MRGTKEAQPARSERQDPTAADLSATLESVLASREFPASERRRAFLRYIVEETIAGRSASLKGFAIAVSVFGRDESFDAQADPVVRIEARRLRRDLDSYYMNGGSEDPIRISIPKGGYVPAFEYQQPPAQAREADQETADRAAEPDEDIAALTYSPAPTLQGWLGQEWTRHVVSAIAVAVIAAGALIYFTNNPEEERLTCKAGSCGPDVFVQPFEALSSTSVSNHVASGITHELISNLLRFPGFRLFTHPMRLEDRIAETPREISNTLGVTYSTGGSVVVDGGNVRVSARLLNVQTGQVVWAQTFERPFTPEALMRTQVELAGHVASAIGQPYGAVNSDLERRMSSHAPPSMQSYLCVLRTYDYRRGFVREKFDPALRCLRSAVQQDPEYADAWAALAWLRIDAARRGYDEHGSTQELFDKARLASVRAESLEPDNIYAVKALAAVEHYVGNYAASETLSRRALALNPHDPENLAQLGWRLAARNNFKEGIPFLERAIARTVNPPGWYYHLISIGHYMQGDFSRMLASAERSASDGGAVSQFLLAIASSELGDHVEAQKALTRLSRFEFFSRDPAAYFRRHGVSEDIIRRLMAGMSKAS